MCSLTRGSKISSSRNPCKGAETDSRAKSGKETVAVAQNGFHIMRHMGIHHIPGATMGVFDIGILMDCGRVAAAKNDGPFVRPQQNAVMQSPQFCCTRSRWMTLCLGE